MIALLLLLILIVLLAGFGFLGPVFGFILLILAVAFVGVWLAEAIEGILHILRICVAILVGFFGARYAYRIFVPIQRTDGHDTSRMWSLVRTAILVGIAWWIWP